MFRTSRRLLLVLCLVLLACGSTTAAPQLAASRPGPSMAVSGLFAQVVTSRSYTVEIAIVVVFAGLALFTVCRSGE